MAVSALAAAGLVSCEEQNESSMHDNALQLSARRESCKEMDDEGGALTVAINVFVDCDGVHALVHPIYSYGACDTAEAAEPEDTDNGTLALQWHLQFGDGAHWEEEHDDVER